MSIRNYEDISAVYSSSTELKKSSISLCRFSPILRPGSVLSRSWICNSLSWKCSIAEFLWAGSVGGMCSARFVTALYAAHLITPNAPIASKRSASCTQCSSTQSRCQSVSFPASRKAFSVDQETFSTMLTIWRARPSEMRSMEMVVVSKSWSGVMEVGRRLGGR